MYLDGLPEQTKRSIATVADNMTSLRTMQEAVQRLADVSKGQNEQKRDSNALVTGRFQSKYPRRNEWKRQHRQSGSWNSNSNAGRTSNNNNNNNNNPFPHNLSEIRCKH